MSESNSKQASTWGGMGRWIAVASELPCAVIALLFAGQIVGQSIGGPSGGMWGAVLGSLLGFAFGVYSVYITIGYFDRLELKSTKARRYMPPMEEIMEDVEFDI
ncbi:MAG: hypothetical protein ACW987_20770, partial [Candidatus Thorarchaeota archaeon]